MNQTLNGAALFIILILIFALLFGLSWLRKPKNSASIKRQPFRKQSSNQHAIKKANLTKKQTKSKVKAKTKPNNKQSTHRSSQQSPIANRELKTLRNKIENDFPQFIAVLRQNHVLLKKTSSQNTTENIAMLTIDKQVDIGRRRLGDVTVINFHSLPGCEELRIELQGL